jgi:hypothetical protein
MEYKGHLADLKYMFHLLVLSNLTIQGASTYWASDTLNSLYGDAWSC